MWRGSRTIQQLRQRRHHQLHHRLSSSSSHIRNVFTSSSSNKNAAAAAAVTATTAIVTISSSYPSSSNDRVTTCSKKNAADEINKPPILNQSGKAMLLGTSNATIQNNAENKEASSSSKAESVPDDYPTFTRYHRSLLAKHLTPSIWSELKNRRTSKGVTLEQIIQSGTSLPYGCDPPRGVGVLAGDAESYRVFAPLFDPIIRDFHGLEEEEKGAKEEKELNSIMDNIALQNDKDDKDKLKGNKTEEKKRVITLPGKKDIQERNILPISNSFRKHTTNINSPHLITKINPDPTGDHILSVRIAVSRSIDGYAFPSTLNRKDRRIVQSLVKSASESLTDKNAKGGSYVPVYSMTNAQNEDLIQRNILFDNPEDWYISAGLGRDWPDGRGVYLNVTDFDCHPNLVIWCNAEDHLRIIGTSSVGDIRGLFKTLSTTVRDVERFLVQSGKRFAYDDQLGFLTSCPSKIGTALRASVHVKLIRLGQCPGFDDMVKRLKLTARRKHLGDLNADYEGRYDQYQHGGKMRYTGIFDVSNAESLGKNEVQLINVMIQGVAKLIELEGMLERGEEVDCRKIGWD